MVPERSSSPWDRMSDEKLREVVRELNLSAVGRLELAMALDRVVEKMTRDGAA